VRLFFVLRSLRDGNSPDHWGSGLCGRSDERSVIFIVGGKPRINKGLSNVGVSKPVSDALKPDTCSRPALMQVSSNGDPAISTQHPWPVEMRRRVLRLCEEIEC